MGRAHGAARWAPSSLSPIRRSFAMPAASPRRIPKANAASSPRPSPPSWAASRRGRGWSSTATVGTGRTGTVIGASLVALGHPPDTVIPHLDALHRARGRAGWPESKWQAELVRGWQPTLRYHDLSTGPRPLVHEGRQARHQHGHRRVRAQRLARLSGLAHGPGQPLDAVPAPRPRAPQSSTSGPAGLRATRHGGVRQPLGWRGRAPTPRSAPRRAHPTPPSRRPVLQRVPARRSRTRCTPARAPLARPVLAGPLSRRGPAVGEQSRTGLRASVELGVPSPRGRQALALRPLAPVQAAHGHRGVARL